MTSNIGSQLIEHYHESEFEKARLHPESNEAEEMMDSVYKGAWFEEMAYGWLKRTKDNDEIYPKNQITICKPDINTILGQNLKDLCLPRHIPKRNQNLKNSIDIGDEWRIEHVEV